MDCNSDDLSRHHYINLLIKSQQMNKIGQILILGKGIAGLCCAKLLAQQGWDVQLWGAESKTRQILVLNEITCWLLRDIFQDHVGTYLRTSHQLNQRNIIWDHKVSKTTVAQPSIVINNAEFTRQLLESLIEDPSLSIKQSSNFDINEISNRAVEFDWVLDATGRNSCLAKQFGAVTRHFGTRCILSTEVPLVSSNDPHNFWIEAIRDGWFFLAPLNSQVALLQLMLPSRPQQSTAVMNRLLQETNYIQKEISAPNISTPPVVLDAFPQILDPFFGITPVGLRWLAIGSAAFAVDPISGDGVGYAIRSAILAASVVSGIISGLPREQCLQHYNQRLYSAFLTHLKACLNYYEPKFESLAWRPEINLMKHLLNKSSSRKLAQAKYTYKLNHFQLVEN